MKRTSSVQSTAKPAKRGSSAARARHRVPGAVYFDEVRGKTLEELSVSVDDQANLITLTFADQTEMTLDVEPGIQVGAMLESWKTGNSRVLNRWRRIFTTEDTEEHRGRAKTKIHHGGAETRRKAKTG